MCFILEPVENCLPIALINFATAPAAVRKAMPTEHPRAVRGCEVLSNLPSLIILLEFFVVCATEFVLCPSKKPLDPRPESFVGVRVVKIFAVAVICTKTLQVVELIGSKQRARAHDIRDWSARLRSRRIGITTAMHPMVLRSRLSRVCGERARLGDTLHLRLPLRSCLSFRSLFLSFLGGPLFFTFPPILVPPGVVGHCQQYKY